MKSAPVGRAGVAAAERLGVFRAARTFFKDSEVIAGDDTAKSAFRASEHDAGAPAMQHLRPAEAPQFAEDSVRVAGADAERMEKQHADLTKVLKDIGDRPLVREDVERILPNINAAYRDGVRVKNNCFECSLALDDALGGKAAVAGPSQGVFRDKAKDVLDGKRALETRGLDRMTRFFTRDFDGLEKELQDRGPGARAIILRKADISQGISGHAYNVANIDGKVCYLDGQIGKIFDQQPVEGFTEFVIFMTA